MQVGNDGLIIRITQQDSQIKNGGHKLDLGIPQCQYIQDKDIPLHLFITSPEKQKEAFNGKM